MAAAGYRKRIKAISRYVRRKWGSTLSPADKVFISKAWKEVEAARRRGLYLHVIRKNPRESDRAYNQRLTRIKANHGVSGSLLCAIPVRKSTSEIARLKSERVVVIKPKTGRQQYFFRFRLAELAASPTREVARMWKLVKRVHASRARLVYGNYRGDMESHRTEVGLRDAVLEILQLYPNWQAFIVGVFAIKDGKGKKRGVK